MAKKYNNLKKGSECKMSKIDRSCFIAKDVELIGKINIGYNTSIWDGVTIMSNTDTTVIGYNSNIQNNTIIYNDFGAPTVVGNDVSIGNNCAIHSCKIHNNVLVEGNAVIKEGVEIGENTIVCAGSVIEKNNKIPPGVLCKGNPAKIVRKLTDKEIKSIKIVADHYIALADIYK